MDMDMENAAAPDMMMDAAASEKKPSEMAMSEKKPSEKASEKPMSEKPMSEKPKSQKDDENTPMMGAAAAGAAGEALGFGALNQGEAGSDNTVKRTPVRTDCCCCLCGCSNELTQGVKCCFCFPIKSGIVLIGLGMFVIAFIQFLNAYYQFANATVPWWKPAVTMVLYVPGFIGACFYIGWYTKDCTRTRATLTPATIQGLTSYTLIILWQMIYFFAIEKKELVGSGFGEDLKTYTWQSKRRFAYYQLGMAVFVIGFYVLAISAVRAYVTCYPDVSPAQEKKNAEKMN